MQRALLAFFGASCVFCQELLAHNDDVHSVSGSSWADPHPLGVHEKYLQPFLEELVDYRDNPIARRYIALANLVDALPTWIEDLLIPLLIPGSTLSIPINTDIPLKIPLGHIKIPLPAKIRILNLSINDLNEFKTLRPLKLMSDSKFTWTGVVNLAQTSVVLNAQLIVLGHPIDMTVTMPVKNPALNFTSVIAYNRTRICDVWGKVMHSSTNCAIWPFYTNEPLNVSGVNLTDFHMSVSDFDFSIKVTGLGSLGEVIEKQLANALSKAKSKIIADLPGILSEELRRKANDFFLHGLAKIQRESPCDASIFHAAKAINVSRVCFANNGGYDLVWKYHNCPAHLVSSDTPGYPIDQRRCMDVKDVFPQAVEGQVLRVATQAIAGIHEIIDPGLRYVPNSNSAGFECSGTTLNYHCDFLSLGPINPASLPRVSQVCIINHAGYVMWFNTAVQRNKSWVASSWTGSYPIDQTQCIDLSTKGLGDPGHSAFLPREGEQVQTVVHALGGKVQPVDRLVEYHNNSLQATFECQGTTLNYDCSLLAVADVVRSEAASEKLAILI